MERIRLKRKFEYHPRDPAALLKRLGRITPEEQARRTAKAKQTKMLNRQRREEENAQAECRMRRLSLKHDAPIPADEGFCLCIRGLARALNNQAAWRRNMVRYLNHVNAHHRPDDGELTD